MDVLTNGLTVFGDEVLTSSVIVPDFSGTMNHPVENHEVRPHGHWPGQLNPIGVDLHTVDLSTNNRDRLVHRSDEVKPTSNLFDLTSLVKRRCQTNINGLHTLIISISKIRKQKYYNKIKFCVYI